MDEVFLTGASGFVGRHVLRALLDGNYRVRALVRPNSKPLTPDERCTPIQGDIRRPGELMRQMEGCRFLIHVAALYSFAPHERQALWETNVRGCAGVLEAARIAGVERAVVTSSSATVGPAQDGRPATEEDWGHDLGPASAYHRSKLEQERTALAAQLPVVLILPTAPVGPGDARPTPTGKMIVDFMHGRIFGSLPGGMNVVPVEDVGKAHVQALQHGHAGERYLVGGENLSLSELWKMLALVSDRPAPTRRIPYGVALAVGWADEIRCRLRPDDQPLAPLEGVRMGRENMFVRDAKARSELGYVSTPVLGALQRAVEWYRAHGYA